MSTVKRNILLTPGPATTTDSVKYAQVVPDICPREEEFGDLIEYVSGELTRLVADPRHYSTVLFGGSGTAAVESILSSAVGIGDRVLIIVNGAYGQRMCEIAEAYGLPFIPFNSPPHVGLDLTALELRIQQSERKISHLAVVHHETTTGLLNDVKAIGEIGRKFQIELIVDAISSFAAIPVHMEEMNIHYLAASSNKNIQGTAGISFVIAETEKLKAGRSNHRRNYYLNLYDQYQFFAETRQTRFTPPVQTLYALKQAIDELRLEGIEARYQRYVKSWETLIAGIKKLGLKYIASEHLHSKLVTSILEPDAEGYDFQQMHDYFYRKGFTIYPGKLKEVNTFRIANIGDITSKDVEAFLEHLESYFETKGIHLQKNDNT
jgi:2-aminoethylphosphonate-pyruvate transaminase